MTNDCFTIHGVAWKPPLNRKPPLRMLNLDILMESIVADYMAGILRIIIKSRTGGIFVLFSHMRRSLSCIFS